MSARRTALLLLAFVAGCARTPAPTSKPAAVPPSYFGASRRPLDPRGIKGVNLGGSALLSVQPGIAGDRVVSLLEIPPGDCAVVIARGSQSIEDLDLLAYGEDGAPLGSDEAPDREPSLMICPPHPGRVVLAARIAQGHGIVVIGSERVPPAQAPQAARRYGVKPHDPADPARLRVWPGLDALIEKERARVGGKFQDLRRVAVALDAAATTTLPASVEAGRCVHALFIPSDDVSHLDVAALDEQGHVLGRAVGSGRQRAIVVCSPVTAEISFEVRPHAGRGLAVAALSRSVEGTESEIQGEIVRRDVYPSQSLTAEVTEFGARLKRRGYPAPVLSGPELELGLARRHSLSLATPSGCSRVDVIGGAPLRGLSARLWDDSGVLHASAAGGGSVTLFTCGGGKLRLDVSALLAPGKVRVLTQPESDAPPELSQLPLAGSRLVGRMVERGVLLRPSAIGKLTQLALTAEQLSREPVLVPVDRCVDADVAIQGNASGVELTAVDVDSGVDLDSSLGENAASVRVCAFGRGALGSLNVRLDVRTTSGAARALLATRLLAPAE